MFHKAILTYSEDDDTGLVHLGSWVDTKRKEYRIFIRTQMAQRGIVDS